MSTPGPWRDAGSPRGPYPPLAARSPSSPSIPAHPFAGANGQPFYPAPIPGFYSPSLSQPAPSLPLGRGAPSFPRPELPPSLVPGRKPTVSVTRSQSSDWFFQDGSPIPQSRSPQSHPAPPAPPIPRKPDTSLPPIPPKPAFSPPAAPAPISPPLSYRQTTRPRSHSRTASNAGPSAPPLPPITNYGDDVVFNRVLDISLQEVERTRELERQREQVRLAEEAELAQALAASLAITRPEAVAETDGQSSNLTSAAEQGPSAAPVPSPVPDISVDSLRRLDARRGSPDARVAQQIMDDEAFALRLAQEEERLAEEERFQKSATRSRSSSHLNPEGRLPQYDEAVSSPHVTSQGSYFPTLAPPSAQGMASSLPSSSPVTPALGRSSSDKPIPPKSTMPEKRMGRSHSVGEATPSASTTIFNPKPQPNRSSSFASSEWDHSEESDAYPASASALATEPPSNTQYLDSESLYGLSMGFGTPQISPTPKPFTGVIPNVVALPYGKCPPFHIMAPSWRTLLKLIARLSGTRLEPTMEAMAVVKTDMRLRVVVSFVKVHHASSEWHTVLYMSIDHPTPPGAPAGWKYRNGDTSTLPWSYNLAQMPPFLRDGPDAALSKFYTIPCTQETPFPTLPISFPNLATYLATALENSRDAMNDSSSGVRRLAKYIDQFYPNDRVVLDDAPERTGMRRRLKNLVGIGSKPQRDRNAEMYELVTPFVPDEYGR